MNMGNAIAGKHPQLSSHGAMHVPTRAQVLASNTPSAFAGASVCLCLLSLSLPVCMSLSVWCFMASQLKSQLAQVTTLHASCVVRTNTSHSTYKTVMPSSFPLMTEPSTLKPGRCPVEP